MTTTTPSPPDWRSVFLRRRRRRKKMRKSAPSSFATTTTTKTETGFAFERLPQNGKKKEPQNQARADAVDWKFSLPISFDPIGPTSKTRFSRRTKNKNHAPERRCCSSRTCARREAFWISLFNANERTRLCISVSRVFLYTVACDVPKNRSELLSREKKKAKKR